MRALAAVSFASVLALASSPALAAGLDRDPLLAEAPAAPDKGTVRVTGASLGHAQAGGGESSVSGNLMWAPFSHFAGDVGAYYQTGSYGPTARVRYQILDQEHFGLDLAPGVRWKFLGTELDRGEVEFLVAVGRRFGRLELIANGVFGVETTGGKDAEFKGYVGVRITDAIRVGVDGRFKAEVGDEEGAEEAEREAGGARPVREYELIGGPCFSWLIANRFQMQLLGGVFVSRTTVNPAPAGLLSLSFDF